MPARVINSDHKMTQEDWSDIERGYAVFDSKISNKTCQPNQRLRGACFTLNNYTEEDEEKLRLEFDNGNFSYLVFGREVGKSGTPHLQGYVHFKQQKSLKQIKALIGNRAHIEYARATGDKFSMRWLYCMKDGDFEEFGEKPQHGGQLKKLTVMDLVDQGKTMTEIRKEMPNAVFHHKKIGGLVWRFKEVEYAKSGRNQLLSSNGYRRVQCI